MEPYRMYHIHNETPLYDERFFNYGYNKVQHVINMINSEYDFKVLAGGFIFDTPHLR